MGQKIQSSNPRGFFAIGIYHPQRDVNIGTLLRTASIFGASYTFTIGKKYLKQSSDTTKSYKHMPHFNFPSFDDMKNSIPYEAQLIGVELLSCARSLIKFTHPRSSIYILGAEDDGLPSSVLNQCHHIVNLPGDVSLNVAVAGSIVLYDRLNKTGFRTNVL